MHEASHRKEALAKARQEALEKCLQKKKKQRKRKKIICRADTVKARQLPMAVREGVVGVEEGVGVGGGFLLMHQSCNFEVYQFSMHVKKKLKIINKFKFDTVHFGIDYRAENSMH